MTGAVSETDEAVISARSTIESLDTLPVFAQIDEPTGLLTALGGTVESLGAVATQTGEALAVSCMDGVLSGATTALTSVIRPLVITTAGATQVVGAALMLARLAVICLPKQVQRLWFWVMILKTETMLY